MYVNQKYYQTPQQVEVMQKKTGKLTMQLDEIWSFVGAKRNKQWIWLALDADTREIVGVYIGSRCRNSAKKLWSSIPAIYRQCAVCYTDFWEAYKEVLPSKRHKAVGKETGKTSYIERFNNTRSATSRQISSENFIILKKVGQSHWSCLVLYSSLQCLTSSLTITIHDYQRFNSPGSGEPGLTFIDRFLSQ